MKLPLYRRSVRDGGGSAPHSARSASSFATTVSMPMIASWAVGAREYHDGNSRHMPTYCPESGDHSARYVY